MGWQAVFCGWGESSNCVSGLSVQLISNTGKEGFWGLDIRAVCCVHACIGMVPTVSLYGEYGRVCRKLRACWLFEAAAVMAGGMGGMHECAGCMPPTCKNAWCGFATRTKQCCTCGVGTPWGIAGGSYQRMQRVPARLIFLTP
jgi:hypothetical protein